MPIGGRGEERCRPRFFSLASPLPLPLFLLDDMEYSHSRYDKYRDKEPSSVIILWEKGLPTIREKEREKDLSGWD